MLKLSFFHCTSCTFFFNALLFPASKFLFNILCVSATLGTAGPLWCADPSCPQLFAKKQGVTNGRAHEAIHLVKAARSSWPTKWNVPLQEGQNMVQSNETWSPNHNKFCKGCWDHLSGMHRKKLQNQKTNPVVWGAKVVKWGWSWESSLQEPIFKGTFSQSQFIIS